MQNIIDFLLITMFQSFKFIYYYYYVHSDTVQQYK